MILQNSDASSDLVPAPGCLTGNDLCSSSPRTLTCSPVLTPCTSSGVCCCPRSWIAKPWVPAPNQRPSCFAPCLAFIYVHSLFGVFSVPLWYPTFISPLHILYSFSIPNISTQFWTPLLPTLPWAHSRLHLYSPSKMVLPFISVRRRHCSKGS